MELKQITFSLKTCKNVENVLNSQFLKKTFNTTGYAVLNFINSSLRTGSFPKELKTTTIIPVAKNQNKSDVSTYRPINTLPCIEKLLEKIVYNQIVSYFNEHNLFLGNQSGFRKGHSCETAIQLTISKWKQTVDNNEFVVAVFLDLRRAFEVINRELLLKKLKYYGFGENVMKWFKEYLTNRFQHVRVGKSKSLNNDSKYGPTRECNLQSFPEKTYFARSDQPHGVSWYTEDIRSMRDHLILQYGRQGDRDAYKRYKRSHKKEIKKPKLLAKLAIKSARNPTKCIWNIINSHKGKLKNKNSRSEYLGLFPHDSNSFFSNIANNLLNAMPQTDVDPLHYLQDIKPPNMEFKFSERSFNEVRDIIDQLSNKKKC
nr:unnamed protein product [Callosobruchus analis]